MLLDRIHKEKLNDLFQILKLRNRSGYSSMDNNVKIEQILAYLDVVHAELRKSSKKRRLVLVDCAAGNCYLSFLINHFYTHIEKRDIEIHCIDINGQLMENKQELAEKMGFDNMHFYAQDISDFDIDKKVDLVYSLHACDTATDKTMHLAIKKEAKAVLTVACCQHSLTLKSKSLKLVTRHKAFRDKILMMISDSMRATLLEDNGYKVNIFDFVSSRYTDKNAMVRAVRSNARKSDNAEQDYDYLRKEFRITPYLEELLVEA